MGEILGSNEPEIGKLHATCRYCNALIVYNYQLQQVMNLLLVIPIKRIHGSSIIVINICTAEDILYRHKEDLSI